MKKHNSPVSIMTMTLRQWYAGMALQGICANADISSAAATEGLFGKELHAPFVKAAFGLADAMIKKESNDNS